MFEQLLYFYNNMWEISISNARQVQGISLFFKMILFQILACDVLVIYVAINSPIR